VSLTLEQQYIAYLKCLNLKSVTVLKRLRDFDIDISNQVLVVVAIVFG